MWLVAIVFDRENIYDLYICIFVPAYHINKKPGI